MDFSISWLAVVAAAAAQFVVGAIWYMPIFGKMWGVIHGFDKLDKKTQAEMRKGMAPWLVVQFVMAALTAYVLAVMILTVPGTSAYVLAFWLWLGFMVPTQASAVIFGGTNPKYMFHKIAIMVGGSLACMEVAAAVLHMIK